MKIKNSILAPMLAVLAMTAPVTRAAEDNADDFFNHLTFSARFGFNIDVRYGPRVNASGGAYDFLDGYVQPDFKADPGGFAFDPTGTYPGGITHNWGYDNSARQNDAGNKEILFTTLAGSGASIGHSDSPDIIPGFEIAYQRDLTEKGKWHLGVEGAASFLSLCLDSHFSYNGPASQFGFPYTFNGVTSNSPPAIYNGTRDSLTGFDISGLPNLTNNVAVSFNGHGKFDANVWGFRLGPTLGRPLTKRVTLTINGGLALGLVDSDASWSETLAVDGSPDQTRSGKGHKDDVLVGYYVGANLTWKISKRWDLNVGVQYQDLGTYSQSVGDRNVELDLSEAIYVTIGASYNF